MIKYFLALGLLLCSAICQAQEVLPGEDYKKEVVQLNEELRKLGLDEAEDPGVKLPAGAVFFMLTGSCPTGTTDVTATYSNKFIKINATQGTSSGTVLTGTADSHTLTTAEIPSHLHTYAEWATASGSNPRILAGTDNNGSSSNTSSTGGGGGHTHTLSSATTLEPSSITCKMCLVD